MLTVAGYSQQTNFPYGIKNPAATIEVSPTMITTHGPTNVYGKVSVNNLPVSIAVQDSLDKKLNISDLPSNLTLYPTTVTSDVSGYVVMVTDIHDVRYDETAVNVSTPSITTTAQLVSSRISDAAVLVGQPGVFNATSFGNIRRLSGSGTANFYFEIYKRTAAGIETLIGISGNSAPVSSSSYLEFTASLVWDDGTFIATDRIVVKSYANRISGGTNPVYQFQFGGLTPVRTVLPVPFSVVDAGYEVKDNKQNSLAVDGTGEKYPTVDAVNAALPKTYSQIVYVNSTNPNTATVFDTANPPITNDNLLKNDVANLYIGTDASTWVYNGSTYTTKTVPETSNFYLAGTTTDAGSVKNIAISRPSSIGATSFVKIGGTSTQALLANGLVLNNPISGTGTVNYIPKFTGSGTVGNSLIFDNGTNVGIGNNASATNESLELRTLSNTGFAMTRNALSNSVRFYFKTGSNYIWSLGMRASRGDFSIFNEPTTTEAFTINTVSSNVLINTVTDDGINKLQVNGSTKTTALTLTTPPTTSAGAYDILTRNTSSGVVEKVLSNTIATVASPTFTGTPTAPTATVGTNTTQIATTAFVQSAATSNIAQTITDGVTTSAPSQNAVFDALVFKRDTSNNNFGGQVEASSFKTGGNIELNSTGTGLYGPANGAITFYTKPPGTPGWTSNTNITATYYKTTVYTVATLPSPPLTGSGTYATVSDALAPTYLVTVVGGGSVVCPVFYDGTNWVAH